MVSVHDYRDAVEFISQLSQEEQQAPAQDVPELRKRMSGLVADIQGLEVAKETITTYYGTTGGKWRRFVNVFLSLFSKDYNYLQVAEDKIVSLNGKIEALQHRMRLLEPEFEDLQGRHVVVREEDREMPVPPPYPGPQHDVIGEDEPPPYEENPPPYPGQHPGVIGEDEPPPPPY